MANPLQSFVDKILELQKNGNTKPFSTSELKEIAESVGISESEWSQIQLTYEGHLDRGNGFLKYENYSDAKGEFDQALLLHPHDFNANFGLAQAYFGMYRVEKNQMYAKNAEKYARLCLSERPKHDPSLQLISLLKKPVHSGTKHSQNPAYLKWLVVAGFVTSIFGFFIFFRMEAPDIEHTHLTHEVVSAEQMSKKDEIKDEVASELPSKIVAESSVSETVLKKTEKTQTVEKTAIEKTKISWEGGAPPEGIIWTKQLYQFSPYDASYSYTLNGSIEAENVQISSLQLKAEVIDTEGKIIHTEHLTVVNSNEPSLLPGESAPFHFMEYKDKVKNFPKISEIRLSVDTYTKSPMQKGALTLKSIPMEWEIEADPNVKINLKERSTKKTKGFKDDSFYHAISLEIENNGKMDLRELVFTLEWYSTTEKKLLTRKLYIITSSDPVLSPGKRILKGGTYEIPCGMEELASYKVKIQSVSY